MFGNTLAEEALLFETVLGFTGEEVGQVLLNDIHASWLPEARKVAMLQAFQQDPVWRLTCPTPGAQHNERES